MSALPQSERPRATEGTITEMLMLEELQEVMDKLPPPIKRDNRPMRQACL